MAAFGLARFRLRKKHATFARWTGEGGGRRTAKRIKAKGENGTEWNKTEHFSGDFHNQEEAFFWAQKADL